MEFIDTHTHITDEAFAGCEEEVVDRALEAGVSKMLLADIDSSERDRMFQFAGKHPGILFPMVGLYPGSVGENWRDELDLMLPYFSERVVAVGEIGLDYHYGHETAELQKKAFAAQLELSLHYGLPVNIHLREATEDFFLVLDRFKGKGLRGNLHAFSGSAETFERVRKYGDWYVGIGGVLTFRNASIAKDIARIPLDRILLETDAPYLAPTPLRGTRNESANIQIIASKLAELKSVTIGEVAEVTTNNAKNLFGI